jgi:hypothetical protein
MFSPLFAVVAIIVPPYIFLVAEILIPEPIFKRSEIFTQGRSIEATFTGNFL